MTHQGDVGGSTNSITWLVQGLAARGHDVFLACRPESLVASRFATGPVRRVAMQLPRGPALFGEAVRWRRWIRDAAIDVVNAHASLDRHLVSYLRVLGARPALVHTRRNVALSSGGWLKARFDAATTDAVVAVSAEVADGLVRHGVPAGHVRVIRNGIPVGTLPEADPARVAALRTSLGLAPDVPVVGVIARRKAQHEVLEAVARLRRPLRILLAGISEDAELSRRIAALPPDVRVDCLGFRDDVAEIHALLDIFVLPSTIEGFSLALLEAMARALPCVATDAGGNREALADGAGRLYPAGNPGALANVLAPLLDDREAARALGRRGRERVVREFDVSITVERTERLYEELVGAGG